VPRSERPAKVAVQWLALLVVPTLVVLVLFEVLIRTTGLEQMVARQVSKRMYPVAPGQEMGLFATRVFDPLVSWRLKPDAWLPGKIGYINSLGFVGREFAWRKTPRTTRILTLGDSVTYGLWACGRGFCRRNPYPSALELLLWGRTDRDVFEVIDGGVYGYNSLQGLRYYRAYLGSLDADVVTVMFGWNDHGIVHGLEGREPRNAAVRMVAHASEQLATYRTLVGVATLALMGKDATPQGTVGAYQPRVTLEDFAYHLEELVHVARARGTHVVFLTEPYGPDYPPQFQKVGMSLWALDKLDSYATLIDLHGHYNDQMRAVAARLGVPLVDVDAEFNRLDKSKLFDPRDYVHPNETGHALIADLLYRRLLAEGWIAVPGATVRTTS
jgi:lysophospholipase L1-like esterase